MSRFCFVGISTFAALYVSSAMADTTAFYYGPSVPRELAAVYDQLVVEPAQVTDPSLLAAEGTHPVAYLSIGELVDTHPLHQDISPDWILARNENWSSAVMDVAHPGWRSFLFERTIEPLWRAGYRRFFLDTLDSYLIGCKEDSAKEARRKGLVTFVREMKRRFPKIRIILNRGFEIIDEVGPIVDGVVAESLYDRWDSRKRQYVRVPEPDRRWLLTKLRDIREKHGLPITVIDYRPPSEREAARRTAQKIADLGFDPWVTDWTVSTVGVGAVEIVRRRVLILTSDPFEGDGEKSIAYRTLAPVIEHLGLVPELHTLADGLPRDIWKEAYLGAVAWLSEDMHSADWERWVKRQVEAGVKGVFFGHPGFDLKGSTARRLGISVSSVGFRGLLYIKHRDDTIGFEHEPQLRHFEALPIRYTKDQARVHLSLSDADKKEGVVIATTPWGGFAQSHFVAAKGPHGETAWILDPFKFIEGALHLPPMPKPDMTTENGRRLAFVLMDAKGLAERARFRGRPRAWRLLRDRLLEGDALPLSLDMEATSNGNISEKDLKAAKRLLRERGVRRGHLPPGSTDCRRFQASITKVQAAAIPVGPGLKVPVPIAPDFSYLNDESDAYHPFNRVIETLATTDTPRRLKAAAIHFHASAAASHGGIATIQRIYEWLLSQEILPVYATEYEAKVLAFRELVVGRHLDGAFQFFGGESLRTVRLPLSFALPDQSRSMGVVAIRDLPQGRYVSFIDGGERRLAVGADRLTQPYVIQTNGTIREFKIVSDTEKEERIHLKLTSHAPIELELGGLSVEAKCLLELNQKNVQGKVNARGQVKFSLSRQEIKSGLLRCSATGREG